MSLCTDKFFYRAVAADEDIVAATGGRIYNTADDGVENEEDTAVPYIIITNQGGQNMTEDKDDVGESDRDSDAVWVEIAASTREELAWIATAVRRAVKRAFAAQDDGTAANADGTVADGTAADADGIGCRVYDYQMSYGAVNFDAWKPCWWMAMNYVCETNADE